MDGTTDWICERRRIEAAIRRYKRILAEIVWMRLQLWKYPNHPYIHAKDLPDNAEENTERRLRELEGLFLHACERGEKGEME